MAFNRLQKILDSSKERQTSLHVPAIILEMTNEYDISEKCIKKRIELIQEVNQDFVIEDNYIFFKQKIEVSK